LGRHFDWHDGVGALRQWRAGHDCHCVAGPKRRGRDGACGDLADDAEVKARALGLGHQYVAQGRLRSSESVSVLLFQTALQLARNRGLFDPGEDLAKRRAAFLTELRDLLRRIDRIEDLAIRRYIRDSQQPGRPVTS